VNKEDLLKFTQLYQQLLMENDEYQKQNEALYDSLKAVTQELEQLREQLRQINQTVTYLDECLECCATPTYDGKNA